MTRLYNEPNTFVDDMTEGLVAAHPRALRQVAGGVVRADPFGRTQVAVVIGGGAGRFPAVTGLVGPGLASGAAVGDIFKPPTPAQVVAVARAANRGQGVLLCHPTFPGQDNPYAVAERLLNDHGIHCRTVAIGDDLGSRTRDGPRTDHGSLGTFLVAKTAGAAAERGLALEVVQSIARKANDRVASQSAIFAPFTLPGSRAPAFTIRAGHMAIGGVLFHDATSDDIDIPTADGLAELLVAALFDAAPDGDLNQPRVAVVLSGSGATTHEELYIVYRRVSQLLAQADVVAVEPVVGQICTSLDAAGVSLGFMWLDDELADFWMAPADTPGFKRTSTESSPAAVSAMRLSID
jgi:dihydroxyacetone kinase